MSLGPEIRMQKGGGGVTVSIFSSLSVSIKLIGNGIISQGALETCFVYKWRWGTCSEQRGSLVFLSPVHIVVVVPVCWPSQ